MRSMFPLLSLALAAVLAGAAGPSPKKGPARESAQCSLGRHVLRESIPEQGRHGLRFSDRPYPHAKSYFDRRKKTPLAERWIAAGSSNLFSACPHLKADAGAELAFATPAEYEHVKGLGPPFLVVRTITAPVMDRAGTEGLVMVADNCPGLCGIGHLWRYERKGGRWVRDAQPLVLWLS